jgi:galactokinase
VEHNLFVSGRLCLFGEHSDWAAEFGRHRGFCLVIGTDQGLTAVAREGDSLLIEAGVPDSLGRPSGRRRQMECPWQAEALLLAAKDQEEFFRYCAGVAHEMLPRPGVRGGLDLRITAMDLPLKKGVSSSAAVCILVAKAFNAVYGLGMFPHELMEAAYLGERLTGSQCGRMDQACIYGKTPVLLTFQESPEPRVEPVFPGGPVEMFIVDLGGRKDTMRILADLRAAYPVDRNVQGGLGPQNERIVRQAYMALGAGDAERLGRLMSEAQETFDRLVAPACPDQLAGPLLHRLLAFDGIARHVHGGKGVGSQGDGTAQFVARGPADRQEAMARIADAFPQMRCFPLTIAAGATARGGEAGAGGITQKLC